MPDPACVATHATAPLSRRFIKPTSLSPTPSSCQSPAAAASDSADMQGHTRTRILASQGFVPRSQLVRCLDAVTSSACLVEDQCRVSLVFTEDPRQLVTKLGLTIWSLAASPRHQSPLHMRLSLVTRVYNAIHVSLQQVLHKRVRPLHPCPCARARARRTPSRPVQEHSQFSCCPHFDAACLDPDCDLEKVYEGFCGTSHSVDAHVSARAKPT